MKHLRVEVNGVEWVSGDFAEISFSDGPAGVRIEGRNTAPAAAGRSGGGGLLDLLAGASRTRTDAAVQEKRASIADRPTPAVEADVEVVEQG